MFFVGASGQLITLILTVCLPFIFILSGSEKIDIQQSTISFYIHHDFEEVSSIDYNTFEFTQYSAEIQTNKIDVEESEFIKIPDDRLNVKWKYSCLFDSGNKAPPVFFCFFC